MNKIFFNLYTYYILEIKDFLISEKIKSYTGKHISLIIEPPLSAISASSFLIATNEN